MPPDHRRVDACAQALHLRQRKEAIAARVATRLDAQVRLDGVPAARRAGVKWESGWGSGWGLGSDGCVARATEEEAEMTVVVRVGVCEWCVCGVGVERVRCSGWGSGWGGAHLGSR